MPGRRRLRAATNCLARCFARPVSIPTLCSPAVSRRRTIGSGPLKCDRGGAGCRRPGRLEVILDDIHVGDEPSLLVLGHLAEQITDAKTAGLRRVP